MTLVASRTETTVAPAPRAIRLAGLAVPGAVLMLCSAATASFATSHVAIAQAVQTLLLQH